MIGSMKGGVCTAGDASATTASVFLLVVAYQLSAD